MLLSRQDQQKHKERSKRGDYGSVVSLLDHYITETLEKLVVTKDDHRYFQGKLQALSALHDDIVSKKE